MNVYASEQKDFIKYENVKQLFKELYNVCKLFEDGNFYYCYCHNLRAKTIKCNLCKFSEFFDIKSVERYLITYRNDEEKLLKVVDEYWVFIRKIKVEDSSALDFFNKEYVWTFRDYRQGIDIRSTLDEIIENNEEIINGLFRRLFKSLPIKTDIALNDFNNTNHMMTLVTRNISYLLRIFFKNL